MPSWSRAASAVVAATFTLGCLQTNVEVRRPEAAVVVPDANEMCPRSCAARKFKNENRFAECLSKCDGSRRVAGVACGDARTPGSECATQWVNRVETRASKGAILGWSAAAGLALFIIIFGVLGPSSRSSD